VGLFEKGLQLVLQPDPIATQLMFLACYRSPQTLLCVGYEAQSKFLGYESLHQAFSIGKIAFAALSSAVG
jgi:hypothetical protein